MVGVGLNHSNNSVCDFHVFSYVPFRKVSGSDWLMQKLNTGVKLAKISNFNTSLLYLVIFYSAKYRFFIDKTSFNCVFFSCHAVAKKPAVYIDISTFLCGWKS